MTKSKFRLPQPKRFQLVYRKENGETGTYTVSLPIEVKGEKFTAYSFGKGVRSFKLESIIEMVELKSLKIQDEQYA